MKNATTKENLSNVIFNIGRNEKQLKIKRDFIVHINCYFFVHKILIQEYQKCECNFSDFR